MHDAKLGASGYDIFFKTSQEPSEEPCNAFACLTISSVPHCTDTAVRRLASDSPHRSPLSRLQASSSVLQVLFLVVQARSQSEQGRTVQEV